jgi:hypothetical protein
MQPLDQNLASSFSEVPYEIVGEIISRIPRIDMSPVYQVCKLWNNVASSQLVPIFRDACYAGDICSILRMRMKIKMGNSVWTIKGLAHACFSNNRPLAEWFIRNGASAFNNGLYGACRGGHKEIVEWMVQLCKEAVLVHPEQWLRDSSLKHTWNQALEGACKGAHREIAEKMLQMGASLGE